MIDKKAVSIAWAALHACVLSEGIIAGSHHFVDLWARDSLFATFGLFSCGELPVAKQTIETFLRFQQADGAVPYRIFRRGFLFPNFRSIQSGGLVLDGGLMTVIAANQLHDERFLQKHRTELRKIMVWYGEHFGDDLISEWFQCEWADAVLKAGNTLYTNILYWKALGDIGETDKQKTIGNKIREVFWNGNYFADWFDYKRQDYFAAHPNMLAIVFGMTTPSESESILDYAKKFCWNGWTLEENYPRYPWWRIPVQNHLVGLSDYHNRGCIWLQPGILYAVGLYKNNKSKESQNVLETIAEKIIEFNGVFEVYERGGRPVRRLLYRSEGPFAWSAGLFLFACRLVGGDHGVKVPKNSNTQKTRNDIRKKSLRPRK